MADYQVGWNNSRKYDGVVHLIDVKHVHPEDVPNMAVGNTVRMKWGGGGHGEERWWSCHSYYLTNRSLHPLSPKTLILRSQQSASPRSNRLRLPPRGSSVPLLPRKLRPHLSPRPPNHVGHMLGLQSSLPLRTCTLLSSMAH